MVWLIIFIPIAQRQGTAFPTTAVGAAREHPDGVDELMARVGFPMRRFTTARYHDARTQFGFALGRFHGSRQVHQAGDRTQDSLRVMHQPDKLPEIGPTAQVQNTFQSRMKMMRVPDLNE
jgi:hypothetical protein